MSRLRRRLASVLVMLMMGTGCSFISGPGVREILQADEVVPYAPDKFGINKTSFPVTLGSGDALLAEARRQASAYCAQKSKAVKVLSESKQDAVPLDRYATAQLLFECA